MFLSGSSTPSGSLGTLNLGSTSPNIDFFAPANDPASIRFTEGGTSLTELTYDGSNLRLKSNYANRDIYLDTPNGDLMIDSTNGNVGINESSPVAKLHVSTADSGVTPSSIADDLFVENNTHGGITIGTPNSVSGYLFFADPDDNAGAGLVYNHSTDELAISAAGTTRITVSATDVEFAAHVLPDGDNDADLGSASKRWANLFVGDLELSNEGSGGNDVDGTEGKWTIQEGEENLYLLNRKNNKKYKFLLEEIE